MNERRRYDVALSFAGEDREYARSLAESLLRLGAEVFFDEYEKARLWGEDLYSHLSDVYQHRAAYVVMFLSKHYAAKLWTNHERKAAQARAFEERGAYILPVRLDDTEIEGVLPTVGYLRWPAGGADALAQLILEKLGVAINRTAGAKMIHVPAGPFTMGSKDFADDRKPEHVVRLGAYYIYKNPVTFGQYRQFCDFIGEEHWSEFRSASDDHPVVNVSWRDAVRYCVWAGVALPSEAQWEKAARGTEALIFPWGNTWGQERCHWRIPRYAPAGVPSRIGAYPLGASPYGALDMVGNVWEWCADWYDPEYYSKSENMDPPGSESGTERVVRGCGWSDDISFPENFHCSARDKREPLHHWRFIGFRCVRSVT